MSHFNCLIPASNYEEAEELLLPYHQYGWGADLGDREKEFLVFEVEVEKDKIQEEARKVLDEMRERNVKTRARANRWKKVIEGEIAQGMSLEDMKKKHTSKYGKRLLDGFLVKTTVDVVENLISTLADCQRTEGKLWELEEEYRVGEYIPALDYYHGGGVNEETGDFGYWHNPNDKWDWFATGGRWTGYFDEFSKNGNELPGGDIFRKKDIDWDKARNIKVQDKIDWRNNMWELLDMVGGYEVTEDGQLDLDEGFIDRLTEMLKEYENKDKALYDRLIDFRFQIGFTDERERRLLVLTPDEIREQFSEISLTYAFVDKEGEWHEQAEMYMFGISGEEQLGYDKEFWEFIDSLDDEDYLMLVDCHI